MIEGVKFKKLTKYCDDRGTFMEIVREDEGFLRRFGQASMSSTYPGVIKAFHYHKKQDDVWYFPVGNAQVVLHDMRKEASSFGKTETYYMGEENPSILLIPSGVAHGYRVLGNKPCTIIYFTTLSYNALDPDEYRIPFDDPMIGYDWKTKFR